jgi:predicted dehydrogenase
MAPLAVAEAAGERPGGANPAMVLTAAVVGVGAVAKQHIACLSQLSGVELAAVCDLSPAVAESAASRFGVPAWFSDHRVMLADLSPDVVHVATPPSAHFGIATDVLAAGAHAIVEKPIVADAGQLEPLLAAAERRDRFVVEDYNYVFNPQVREMRRLLASGELGRLAHVEVDLAVDILGDAAAPHPTAGMPGGAVADFLPHLASIVYFLVGPHRDVSTVWAENELRALVEAERGTAALSFSATSQPDGFWVRVHGSRMRVEANLFEPRLTIERTRAAPAPLFPVLNGLSEIGAVARAAAGGLWGKLRGAPGAYAGLWHLLDLTYASIARGDPPPVSHADIRLVNHLVSDLTAERQRP